MTNPETSKRASLNKAHPRTSTEIINEQRAQAKAEKAAHAAAKAESAKAVVPAKDTAVALPDHRSDLEKHLDEIAPMAGIGRLLKLGKDGKIVCADTGEEIDADTTFIILADQILAGYVKFDPDGVLPPERIQGLNSTAASFHRHARHSAIMTQKSGR